MEPPSKNYNDQLFDKLYDVEIKAFPSNLQLPKNEFTGMFSKDTVYSYLKNNGSADGFIVFNPIKSSLYEISENDIDCLRNSLNGDFERFIEQLDNNGVYYLDDVASLVSGGLTTMLEQIKNDLPEFVVYHGRLRDGIYNRIMKAITKHSYYVIYNQVEKDFMGGEDFMFVVLRRRSNSN